MSVPLSPVGNLCEARFLDGVRYHAIAAEAGVSWQTVAQFLSRRGYWTGLWGARRDVLAPAEAEYRALVDALPPGRPDDAVLVQIWALDVPGTAIGRLFMASDAFASARAKALDLPPRGSARVLPPAPVPRAQPAVIEPSLDPLEWAVLRTGGRYGALAEVCGKHGLTMVRALQIWHRLRVSEGRAAA
jgi:hypothetical protein